ncbi:MAG: ComEC/Rec2 family competence protein [Patescibacteria group bacterium]
MKVIKRILIVLFLGAVLAGRYFFELPSFDVNYIGSYLNQNVIVEARFIQPPDENMGSLEVLKFKELNHWYELHGRVTVFAPFLNEFEVGDLVEITGTPVASEKPDPRTAAVFQNPKIRLIKSGGEWDFFRIISGVKKKLINRLNSVFPEPAASLASGILLGARSSIPKDIKDDFKKTGLTHILAVSGFNITIVIAFVSAIFAYLPRKISSLCSVVAIVIFTFLVGASASVVRAAIMGSLTLIAKMFGRRTAGMRTLLVAGFIMAVLDPFIIFYDIGFQLSFGATAGLILFGERIKKYFEALPNWLCLRDNLSATCSAQVFTFPLLIFYFGGFSAITTAANLIILPFISPLMLGSFLSLIFGKIIAAPTLLVFDFVIYVIHFLASLPFSFIEVGIL